MHTHMQVCFCTGPQNFLSYLFAKCLNVGVYLQPILVYNTTIIFMASSQTVFVLFQSVSYTENFFAAAQT